MAWRKKHVVVCLTAVAGTAGLLDGAMLPAQFARPAARVARPNIRTVAQMPATEEAAATKTKERLNVRIDDEWYDLTNWRQAHPAGAHWIDAYRNEDATEVRDASRRQNDRARCTPHSLLTLVRAPHRSCTGSTRTRRWA